MLRGKVGNRLEIESKDVRPTHIKELKTFLVFINGKFLGKAYYFSGRGYYTPWLEIDYDPWLRNEGLEDEFFSFVYHFLPPGGKFFVTYLKDPETRKMLIQGYNPADTHWVSPSSKRVLLGLRTGIFLKAVTKEFLNYRLIRLIMKRTK